MSIVSKTEIWRRKESERMLHKNKEGYPDPTAADAIQEADRPPEHVCWFIRTVKSIASLVDLEVTGRIWVKDKKTGREYR